MLKTLNMALTRCPAGSFEEIIAVSEMINAVIQTKTVRN